MTIERVTLPELDAVASLTGENGNSEVVDVGGKLFLRGRFAVVLNGMATQFSDLAAANAQVVREGNGFRLESILPASFTFPQNFIIQPHPDGPWLCATRVTLVRGGAANAPTLLSLDDASISVVPDQPPAPGQKFYFPKAAGATQVPLTPISGSGVFGFFIRPLGDGSFGVRAALANPVSLDHHAGTSVVISRDTFIAFRLGDPPHRLAALASVDSDVAPQPLLLRNGANLNVVLDDTTGAALDQRSNAQTFVRCRNIEIGEGWLSATAMDDAQPDVGVTVLHRATGTGTTKLLSAPQRLRYHTPLAKRDGQKIHAHSPHFAYRDDAVEQPAAERTIRERQHGMRIRGLSSVRGGQAKLDANWAVADIKAGRLHFRAGGVVQVRGVPRASMLVPKPDPENREVRTLVVAAGVAQLRCSAPRVPTSSPLILDSEAELLEMDAVLEVPPGGSPGSSAVRMQSFAATGASPDDFARWQLTADGPMKLRVTDAGVFPRDGADWPAAFTGSAADFSLVEHPGSGMKINPPPRVEQLRAAAATQAPATVTTAMTTVKASGAGKELLVYTALGVALIIKDKVIDYVTRKNEETILDNDVRIELQNLEDQDVFKRREVDNFIAVYLGPAGEPELIKFIDLQRTSGNRLVWPFASGLAVLLWDETLGHAPKIVRDRGLNPAPKPGMAIDQSSIESVQFADFGWDAADRRRFAQESLLWPRLSGRGGAQLDPTDATWRGVMLRDLPLVLAINPNEITDKAKFLRGFFDAINSNLLLEYGWKDETGSTWRGGFAKQDGISINNDPKWLKNLDLQLIRFTTRGSAGRIVGAEGTLRVILPRITSNDAEKKPLAFTGTFAINISNGVRLERIEFAPENPRDFATSSVPGFDSVEVVRFSSDLETMSVTLRLTPSAALGSVLPFLGGGQTVDVTALVPLTGDASLQWSFALRNEIQTNLFGRWPMTVQGLELSLGDTNKVVMRTRINLGLPAFGSVGAKLVLTEQADGTWTFDVQLEEISGELSIGDFRLRAALSWSTENDASGPVAQGALATARQRDFWGEATLDTGGLVDGTVLLRVGNVGELSYWIGALRVKEIDFGPAATLQEPALLIAHHVDFDGKLEASIVDVQTSIAEVVRPPDSGATRGWLARWLPSPKIGTLIAGSGYLNIHDEFAAAPKDPKPEDFTCLLVTDSGLFRAEATIMLFQAVPARVGLAVDLPNKRFSAGIQLPEFTYGAFTVRAGQIAFGLGWGAPYFLMSVGWPEPINGNVMNRDWSKSVMIHWDGAFPINTFWGGTIVELLPGELYFGLAFRAGWTWAYSVSIGGVAKGSASLGVALGGVVELYFQFSDARAARSLTAGAARPARALLTAGEDVHGLRAAVAAAGDWNDELLEVLAFAAPHIEAIMPSFSIDHVSAQIAYYADVWGKASAELFGVTLASIDVGAHAAFVGCVQLIPHFEIVRLQASVEMHLSVRIGCVTVGATASIDITIRNTGGICLPRKSGSARAFGADERKVLA